MGTLPLIALVLALMATLAVPVPLTPTDLATSLPSETELQDGAATSTVSAAVSSDELPPGGTFQDDNGSVHEPNIEALVHAGLTTGCNPPHNTRFCPVDTLRRDQMAAYLDRAADLPRSWRDWFTDDDGSIFERNINAVAQAGITVGCNSAGDRFCPRSRVTRGQFASMLTRTFGYATPGTQRFVDTAGSVHRDNIEAVAAAGVTIGCNPPANDRFCPDDAVTRGQLATFLARALDLDPIVPPPPLDPPGAQSCVTGSHSPNGRLDVVSGGSEVVGTGKVWRFRVEVEAGLAIDHTCFAEEALRILNDERGWGADGKRTFQWVDGSAAYDFRLILASPKKTDLECAPLPTGGIYSCRNGVKVVLNQWRWQSGAAPFGNNLTVYRQYLVNHEVGHRLGHGHRGCSSSGAPAPVMMQQTKFVSPCTINGWPLASERSATG